MRDNAKRDNKRRVTVSEVQSHVRNHSTSTALPVHVDQSIDEKKPVSMEKLICIDDDETVGITSKEEAPIAASLSQAVRYQYYLIVHGTGITVDNSGESESSQKDGRGATLVQTSC